jgi:hypothetical protein
MTHNAGLVDRVARIILGVVLLSLFLVGPKTSWGLLGVIPLLTGIVGFCPAYELFGFSTCSANTRKPASTHF